MGFIEIEKKIKTREWSMSELHSHSHYEIYILIKGKRQIFLKDEFSEVEENTVWVFPPYELHKTEGGPFERVNINVSAKALSAYEIKILDYCAAKREVLFTERELKVLLNLSDEMRTLREIGNNTENIQLILGYFIYKLYEKFKNTETKSERIKAQNAVSPQILKLLAYLNENYAEKISLGELSRMFFVSKATLCKSFKQATNLTIADYLITLRINKAKELLAHSSERIEEISENVGFSSANYFGLIFKNKIGLSPSAFRKYERSK